MVTQVTVALIAKRRHVDFLEILEDISPLIQKAPSVLTDRFEVLGNLTSVG